jgi:hypothetical protein
MRPTRAILYPAARIFPEILKLTANFVIRRVLLLDFAVVNFVAEVNECQRRASKRLSV